MVSQGNAVLFMFDSVLSFSLIMASPVIMFSFELVACYLECRFSFDLLVYESVLATLYGFGRLGLSINMDESLFCEL